MADIFKDKTWLAAARRLGKRHDQFRETFNDINTIPTRVFEPLTKVQMDELALIREVSDFLQKKKNEDIQKAEAALQEEVSPKDEQVLETKDE